MTTNDDEHYPYFAISYGRHFTNKMSLGERDCIPEVR
jgi:hypothetical protein